MGQWLYIAQTGTWGTVPLLPPWQHLPRSRDTRFYPFHRWERLPTEPWSPLPKSSWEPVGDGNLYSPALGNKWEAPGKLHLLRLLVPAQCPPSAGAEVASECGWVERLVSCWSAPCFISPREVGAWTIPGAELPLPCTPQPSAFLAPSTGWHAPQRPPWLGLWGVLPLPAAGTHPGEQTQGQG